LIGNYGKCCSTGYELPELAARATAARPPIKSRFARRTAGSTGADEFVQRRIIEAVLSHSMRLSESPSAQTPHNVELKRAVSDAGDRGNDKVTCEEARDDSRSRRVADAVGGARRGRDRPRRCLVSDKFKAELLLLLLVLTAEERLDARLGRHLFLVSRRPD
jgi:hypothetical protein